MERGYLSLTFSKRPILAWVLWSLTLLLAVADVLTTNYIISLGGREINPVIGWFMKMFGSLWVVPKITITAFIGLFLIGHWNYRFARVAMFIVVVALCFTVGWNLFFVFGGRL